MLELVPLRGEDISRHTHKTGCWYLSEDLVKVSDEHRHLFLPENPQRLV